MVRLRAGQSIAANGLPAQGSKIVDGRITAGGLRVSGSGIMLG